MGNNTYTYEHDMASKIVHFKKTKNFKFCAALAAKTTRPLQTDLEAFVIVAAISVQ